MSHSKSIKRGGSLYVDKWNPSAKKYINRCCICGHQGYNPVIMEDDFHNKRLNLHSEKRAIYEKLTKKLKPLILDDLGRCDICAKLQK